MYCVFNKLRTSHVYTLNTLTSLNNVDFSLLGGRVLQKVFRTSDRNSKVIVGNNGNVTSKFRKVKLTYAEAVKCKKAVQMQNEYIGEGKDPLNSTTH